MTDHAADTGSIICKCYCLQLQLLWNFMITDYNYFFLNLINYSYCELTDYIAKQS